MDICLFLLESWFTCFSPKRNICEDLTSLTTKYTTTRMWSTRTPTFNGFHCTNNVRLFNGGPPVRVDTLVLCVSTFLFRQCVQCATPPFTLCKTTPVSPMLPTCPPHPYLPKDKESVHIHPLGCNSMWTYRQIPAFWNNIMPLSSGFQPWRRG